MSILKRGTSRIKVKQGHQAQLLPNSEYKWAVYPVHGGEGVLVCAPDCSEEVATTTVALAATRAKDKPSGVSVDDGGFGSISRHGDFAYKEFFESFYNYNSSSSLGSFAANVAIYEGLFALPEVERTWGDNVVHGVKMQAAVIPATQRKKRSPVAPIWAMDFVRGSTMIDSHDTLPTRTIQEDLFHKAIALAGFDGFDINLDMHHRNYLHNAEAKTITKIDVMMYDGSDAAAGVHRAVTGH